MKRNHKAVENPSFNKMADARDWKDIYPLLDRPLLPDEARRLLDRIKHTGSEAPEIRYLRVIDAAIAELLRREDEAERARARDKHLFETVFYHLLQTLREHCERLGVAAIAEQGKAVARGA